MINNCNMDDKITPKGKNNSYTFITSCKNSNSVDLKSNTDLNNKLTLECSYLMNQIKSKKPLKLNSIQSDKKRIFTKKLFIMKTKKTSSVKNLSNQSKEIPNLNKIEDISSKDPIRQNKLNSEKSISLKSLFNLPKLKSRNKFNINQHVIKNNNFSLNLHKKKTFEQEYNPKNKDFFSVDKFMKENYYSDVENKFNNQIKTIYFRKGSEIKKEIIAVKKFQIFWNRFLEYSAPIIYFKKYQALRKYSLNKNTKLNKVKIVNSNSAFINIKNRNDNKSFL